MIGKWMLFVVCMNTTYMDIKASCCCWAKTWQEGTGLMEAFLIFFQMLGLKTSKILLCYYMVFSRHFKFALKVT